MYILLAIVALIVLLVVGVLIAAARQPREFHVERSITTSAPADRVFAVFSDLARWREWSPYDKHDPDMKTELSAPSHGEGATYAWNGNKKVGEGRLTVARVEPGRAVALDLEFTRPFKCRNHVTWRVEDESGQRRVTWSMDGRNDDLMPRIFSLLIDMDTMCGKDFEAGLATLKAIAEQDAPAGAT